MNIVRLARPLLFLLAALLFLVLVPVALAQDVGAGSTTAAVVGADKPSIVQTIAYGVATALFSNPWCKAVVGLMLANLLVGVATACMTHTFRLGSLMDWTSTKAVPYLLGGGAVQLVVLTVPDQYSGLSALVSSAVWGGITAALAAHVLDGLKQIGVPGIPDFLTAQHKPDTTATP